MRFEPIGRFNQSKAAHLKQVIVILACLLGVMPGDGSHQVQVVLNLLVSMPDAVLVQRMHVMCFSSHGIASKAMASVPPRHGFDLLKTCARRYKAGHWKRV